MNKELDVEKLLDILKTFPEGGITKGYHRGDTEFLGPDLKLDFEYSTSGDTISLTVEDLGVFRKHREYVAASNGYKVIFSFSPEKRIAFAYSKRFNKRASDILCERILPFIVSNGKDKDMIPLILNDFPEYAGFALNFVPKADR